LTQRLLRRQLELELQLTAGELDQSKTKALIKELVQEILISPSVSSGADAVGGEDRRKELVHANGRF
jgi:hypothetical protein